MKNVSLEGIRISPEELKKKLLSFLHKKEVLNVMKVCLEINYKTLLNHQKIMSRNKLQNALKSSENKSRIEKIREEIKELSRKFSKLEIKEIQKNFMR